MEKNTGRVANRGRFEQSSPERGRAAARETAAPPVRRVMKVLKKVQVVYYLTRNGQLEQPHFMEVSHLADQQIRLKDFIDRLVVLRGRGMPSQYSWSCKRSYKNGFVWNDLTENDVIHPSEGAEYILKGSEIILPCSAETERLDKRVQAISITNLRPKLNSLIINDEEVEEFEGSNGQICRCSKGEVQMINGSTRKSSSGLVENPDDDGQPSPMSTTSTLSSEKGERGGDRSRAASRRFTVAEDGDSDPTAEIAQGRGSVLLQLIACGGSVAAKGKGIPCLKQQMSKVEGRVSNVGGGGGGLRREVVCKAAAVAREEVEMIKYMSENPRFGNLQSEEKEYFSGSILEAMNDQGRAQVVPCLKKSSSYKEERSIKAELGEKQKADEDDATEPAPARGKSNCIPNPIRKHSKQSRT